MPSMHNAGDESDVLNKLMDMLAGNGDITEDTRRKVQAEVLYEILSRVRKIEKESPAGLLKRKPVQATVGITVAFVLLHEFATYVNIGVFLAAAVKMLGIPIP